MKSKIAVLMCLIALLMCQSCRMLDVLAGNQKAGTVDRLWSDVPPVQGAEKADLAIPLAARLIVRTLMQGKVNFIAFTAPGHAQEVQDFYSDERMKAAGWTPTNGCVADTDTKPSQGAVCTFIRPNDENQNGLIIVIAEDAEKKQTQIFYLRFDVASDEIKKGKAAGSEQR